MKTIYVLISSLSLATSPSLLAADTKPALIESPKAAFKRAEAEAAATSQTNSVGSPSAKSLESEVPQSSKPASAVVRSTQHLNPDIVTSVIQTPASDAEVTDVDIATMDDSVRRMYVNATEAAADNPLPRTRWIREALASAQTDSPATSLAASRGSRSRLIDVAILEALLARFEGIALAKHGEADAIEKDIAKIKAEPVVYRPGVRSGYVATPSVNQLQLQNLSELLIARRAEAETTSFLAEQLKNEVKGVK